MATHLTTHLAERLATHPASHPATPIRTGLAVAVGTRDTDRVHTVEIPAE